MEITQLKSLSRTDASFVADVDALFGTNLNVFIDQINALIANGVPSLSMPPFRNRLINPNFSINQTGVSGSVGLSPGVYGHDGWKGGAGSGGSYTFSKVNNITTITITSGVIAQVVDGEFLQSGIHTLGWNGTAQARVDGGTWGNSGMTATAVGGVNQVIEFGVGTLSFPQYEPGMVRTPCEIRDDELRRCQRYCRPISGFGVAGQAYSTTAANLFSYGVPMRATPSAVNLASGAITNAVASNLGIVSAIPFSSDDSGMIVIAVTVSSGLVAGNATYLNVTGSNARLEARL